MTLALLLLSILPHETVVREQVDLVELNHKYSDETGDLCLEQIIYYEWKNGRYQVVSWRMLKSPLMIPYRDHSHGGYTAVWVDDQNTLRVLRADAFRETFTSHDPELLERTVLPSELRRGLKQTKGR